MHLAPAPSLVATVAPAAAPSSSLAVVAVPAAVAATPTRKTLTNKKMKKGEQNQFYEWSHLGKRTMNPVKKKEDRQQQAFKNASSKKRANKLEKMRQLNDLLSKACMLQIDAS